MMSRKFSLLPTVTLVCLIFLIGLIQTVPLNERYVEHETAFADFGDHGSPKIPEGRFTFTNVDKHNSVRITGQFNKGFLSPDVNNYEFLIKDKKGNIKIDLTKEFRKQIHINVPGTSPFQAYCEDKYVKDFINYFFVIKCEGEIIGKSEIYWY